MNRPLARWVLFFSLAALVSCSYITDRAIDFTDQYRFVVGAGTGGGMRFNYMGLLHTGLLLGVKPQATSFGWKYGRPQLLGATARPAGLEVDQSWVFFTTTYENWDFAGNDYKMARSSFGLLPVLFTWTDSTYRPAPKWYVPETGVELEGDHYLWDLRNWRTSRYAMVHAFDWEFEMGALVYIDWGFSIGETLDFLLGFLTIDIAGDDRRLSGATE